MMSFATNLFRSFFSSPAPLGESSTAPHRPDNHSDDSEDNDAIVDLRSDALKLEMAIQQQLEEEYQQELREQQEEREQQELGRGDGGRGENGEVVDEERDRAPSPPRFSTEAKGKMPMREEGNQRQVRFDIGEGLSNGEGSSTGVAARGNTAQETNSSDDAWTRNPKRKARELAESQSSNPDLDVASLIQQRVGEPEYALRDIEIRDSFWKILNQVEGIAETHFAFDLSEDADHATLTNAFGAMTRSTVKIIGCLASGGPEGEAGWRSLFYDEEKRRALVCAIISNVLNEQVFQHLFFGGTPDSIRAVAALQEIHKNADGFERTRRYAAMIRSILTPTIEAPDLNSAESSIQASVETPPETPTLPANFAGHTNHITAAIWTHLKPIYRLYSATVPIPLIEELHTIVAQAGILSLQMRLDGHTVYRCEHLIKETFYDTTRMESFNTVPADNEDPDFNDDSDGEAVIQICIMGGLTAYRQGGWETSASTLANPVFEEGCEGVGIRERPLTHGWVYCRMGDPRPVGGRAEGGFVEFFPGVKGTRDPHVKRDGKA